MNTDDGLRAAIAKMRDAGVAEVAIGTCTPQIDSCAPETVAVSTVVAQPRVTSLK